MCNLPCRYLTYKLVAVVLLLGVTPPLEAESKQGNIALLPLEQFSPGLLGMYRKVMKIEDDITAHSNKYGVDVTLAKAVCLHESGGNARLNSGAGAQGYFQVMPATFRSLGVKTNIEGGIKYLSQMIRRFDREDYALAAYNGGPSRVVRGRPPLETLQYVIFVGQYRNVLKLYEPSVRHHASTLMLERVRTGDDWWTISRRVGVSVLQLRLHNPFLSTRTLQVGQLMAYPPSPRSDLLVRSGNDLQYTARHGDNYLLLSFVLDVDRDTLRDLNGLWRLQHLPAGQVLKVPLEWKGKFNEYKVVAGDDLASVSKTMKSRPWRIIRDNSLFWDEMLTEGMTLKVRPLPPIPTYVSHRVVRGDTLIALARRYNTTVGAIQAANNLGRTTKIRIGQRLRIPNQSSD